MDNLISDFLKYHEGLKSFDYKVVGGSVYWEGVTLLGEVTEGEVDLLELLGFIYNSIEEVNDEQL